MLNKDKTALRFPLDKPAVPDERHLFRSRLSMWRRRESKSADNKKLNGADILRALLSLPALTAFLFLPSAQFHAVAHEASTGWSYPYQCCHDMDCRPVSAKSVAERPEGYVITGTGEVVGYHDSRVRQSPDGFFHWCSVAGKSNSRTICLFVPPRSS